MELLIPIVEFIFNTWLIVGSFCFLFIDYVYYKVNGEIRFNTVITNLFFVLMGYVSLIILIMIAVEYLKDRYGDKIIFKH